MCVCVCVGGGGGGGGGGGDGGMLIALENCLENTIEFVFVWLCGDF